MSIRIRIGTRGSQLAMRQTETVAEALRSRHPGLETEIVRIVTSGDWRPADGETRLSEAEGGKGLFAREIEQALLRGEIDCGVHSMKDMPSFLPEGLRIVHMLPREDARDVLLSNGPASLTDLPPGSTVGTSSLRRQAFLLARRRDIRIMPLRGNVPTRIQKLRAGQVDATLLALAGLRRLGLEHEISSILSTEDMLPAAGQGAIGVETRTGDDKMSEILDPLHCHETGFCVHAERAALQILNGSCHTPIGAHAVLRNGMLYLKAAVAAPDGSAMFERELARPAAADAEAATIGAEVGMALKAAVPPGLLA